MNMKTTIPLAVAVVLGLVAAIVASQLIKQRPVVQAQNGQAAVMNLAEVVVAARDIAPGKELGSDDLKTLRIESSKAPEGVAANPSMIFKRVAKIQIPAGQMVHESMLAEAGVSGGLPGVIPTGMRAMTVEINEFTGVAGLLEPGNRIDVLARVAEAEGNTQMTKTIVQNVQIIAVGPNLTNKQATGESAAQAPIVPDAPPQAKAVARSVTLLVTPEDAEKIDLATSTNNARLVLRASTDNATAKVPGATISALRGEASRADRRAFDTRTASAPRDPADTVFGPDVKPTFKPKLSTRSITVIRAGVTSQIDVDEPKSDAEGTDASAGGADFYSTR